jgi:endoglucanase
VDQEKIGNEIIINQRKMHFNNTDINRRKFINLSLFAALAPVFDVELFAKESINSSKLPRWRGFNLTEKFDPDEQGYFHESDFKLISGWGFDFVRVPISYLCYSSFENWKLLDDCILKDIDKAVAYGRKYKIHINLNLHRIPGYCINPPKEPLNLWTDDLALEAACFHWAQFAKRYKGISSEELSFDLINEPPDIAENLYVRVVKKLVEAIRKEDPQRLIIADGLKIGTKPVFGLKDLKVAQSLRGYEPKQISHYKAWWVQEKVDWVENPTWPLKVNDQNYWDIDRLRNEIVDPWKELGKQGVGLHVGEWGVYNKTPHITALAWMEDNLKLWKEAGWGCSLWNFKGDFGIINSDREDVKYENLEGLKLDRKMLELLQKY